MRKTSVLLACMAAGALPSVALANFGDLTFGPIDVEAFTANNGNLGVDYFAGTDQFHVSFRRPAAGGDNAVAIFDSAGSGVGTPYSQIAGAIADAWGYRDGTNDGTSVYFGWGGGVARHNPDGTGGTLLFDGTNAPGGTWRALAK